MLLKYRTTFEAHGCLNHERNFIYTFRRSSAYSRNMLNGPTTSTASLLNIKMFPQ